MQKFKITNCPTVELSHTNRAIVGVRDPFSNFEHIAVRYPGENEAFVFTIKPDAKVQPGEMAFNQPSRKWASLMAGREIEAAPYKFEVDSQSLTTVKFSVDFVSKQNVPKNVEFDTEDMSKQFNMLYCNQALTVGQIFGFPYQLNKKSMVLNLKVEEMEALSYTDTSTSKVEIGLTLPNTVYYFEAYPGSEINLTGKLSGSQNAPQIFQQNWDFSSLGIGGLDEQFKCLFRRAFASRLLPPKLAEQIGVNQVRGILLYGPPGTGKTLIARQIGKMLLAREPKVVNGPEILNKYVGESESNIRKLFAEAEEELAKSGINSGLHMIIFDEIDAICKQRGSNPSSAGVGDNVVNQLLSKIDGVNALTNILLIGMTNRKDLIDEALLRPGRFEVQIEIDLPNQEGRRQILDIHTAKIRNSNRLDESVNLDELAELTKNYTGAEIAGLVGAAMSRAINRVVTIDSKVVIDENNFNEIRVTRNDFILAMKEDIKPAFCKSDDLLNRQAKPMMSYDGNFEQIQLEMDNTIEKAKKHKSGTPYFMLLSGPNKSGLTTIAANMARRTDFPFIHLYNNCATAGDTESTKIHQMSRIFQDASRSEFSCIVLDDIEEILNYSQIGQTYLRSLSNQIFGLRNFSIPEGRKMLVICTCRSETILKQLGFIPMFKKILEIPLIHNPAQVDRFIRESIEEGLCSISSDEVRTLIDYISTVPISIGVKSLEEIIRYELTEVAPSDRPSLFAKLLELESSRS